MRKSTLFTLFGLGKLPKAMLPILEQIFETADPAEVEIVKSILNGADIPFLVEGMEKFSTFKGGHAALRFNPNAGSVTFVVPADRVEEARIRLTETEPGAIPWDTEVPNR